MYLVGITCISMGGVADFGLLCHGPMCKNIPATRREECTLCVLCYVNDEEQF